MRPTALCLFLVLAASCGAPAVLVTDPIFRAAAPEVRGAWKDEPPGSGAELLDLPEASTLADLTERTQTWPQGTAVLVGTTLGPADRAVLTRSRPGLTFRFFSSYPDAGPGDLTVSPLEGRTLVVKAAAQAHPGSPALALVGPSVPAEDLDVLTRAWTSAGGGPWRFVVWPGAAEPAPGEQVFQWVGAEADAAVLALGPEVAVHGDPGTVRSPGASGFEWRVKAAGLAAFLRGTLKKSSEKPEFLPLETVLVRR